MVRIAAKMLVIAIVGLVILPTVSFAQINLGMPYALSNELEVNISPSYPKPNERVSINLALYTGDLNSARITWYQEGEIVLEGRGKTKYSFITGPAGESTDIEVQIELLNNAPFSKSITINPASVDLIWEADSYVPPFFKGKALHSKQGPLKIVAMPEFVSSGERASAENLIYKWSGASKVYQNQSGYGRNILLLDGSILGRGEFVSVLVTNPLNDQVAEGSVGIKVADSQLIFYQNDLYYGHVFDSAVVEDFDLKSEEVQILASPYYFTKSDLGSLEYKWELNNQEIPDLLGSKTAIFRKPEEGGRSIISLKIENPNHILQEADNRLIIQFED